MEALGLFALILLFGLTLYSILKIASDNDDMVEKMIHDAFERAKKERRKGGKK